MCSLSRATAPMSKTTAMACRPAIKAVQASTNSSARGESSRAKRAAESGFPSDRAAPARAGPSRAALLVQLHTDLAKEPDVLLVDTCLAVVGTRMALGIAARDDVPLHLLLEMLRAILVEIDDRRNIAGDV